MRPGTKPAPTTLKLLRGVRADRINPHEPRLPIGLPEPPEFVRADPAALAEWVRFGEQLVQMGVMTPADGTALAIYCTLYSHWRQAEDKVRKQGLVIVAPSGLARINPHVHIAAKAQAEMVRLLVEFGCTPSSRSRVTTTEKPRDALADFLSS